jgi:Zn-dependent M28 family amino/carboxypeptidase
MATSYRVGAELAQRSGLTLRIFANSERSPTTTWNVLAESDTGRDDNVVIVGAHLDSVPVGPGINDNGSGAGTLLEVAEDMKHVRPTNRVRFAWWGAEELGTVGSAYYVSTLPQDQRDAIALYLNFDMIGSPNPVRFVYDGDGSEFGTIAPEGSAAIEDFFTDFYADRGLASEPTPIEFSSDYAIFFGVGIPFGGVFTGSSGIKTPEQAAVYGGRAGEPYDPCYHAACDDEDNVNLGVLDLNADAVATATLHYAMSTESVNGLPGGSSWWPFW